MSLIKTPWTSQPQQSVGIDWGNPITRGLVIAAIPAHRFAMDKPATVPGAFDLVSGLNGIALNSNGATNSHVYWPIPRKDYGTKTTLLSFCSAPAQASVLRSAVSVGSTSTSTPFMRLGSLGAMSSFGASYRSDTSADFSSSAVANVFDSTPKIAICVTNDTEQKVFVNGVVGATRSTVAGWACTVDTFTIGAHQRAGSVSDRFDGKHFLGAFWERPLSDAEILSISKNPWQIFKPLPRRIFAPVATGGSTTAVTADHNASYTITGSVAADASAAYAIRAAVASDLASSYAIQTAGTVTTGLDAAYAVRGSVAGDISVGYQIAAAVQAEVAAAYAVRAAVQKDLAAGYAIQAGLSAVSADLISAYAINGVLPGYPSAESIAAAVLAAISATTIPVNVQKVNGVALAGSGTEADPMRPA